MSCFPKALAPDLMDLLVVVIDVVGKKDPKEAAQAVMKELSALPNVAFVAQPNWNQANTIALISVIPKTGPNSIETVDLVHYIRNDTDALQKAEEVKLYITGATAVNIDVSAKLNSALPVFALVVVGLALILLALVFRPARSA